MIKKILFLCILSLSLLAACYAQGNHRDQHMYWRQCHVNYTWTIANFSTVVSKLSYESGIYSSAFWGPCEYKYKLLLYPSSKDDNGKTTLSITLVKSHNKTVNYRHIYEIALLNKRMEKVAVEKKHVFVEGNDKWAWKNFKELSFVLDKEQKILTPNDDLRFFVDLRVYVVSYVTPATLSKKNVMSKLGNYFNSEKYSNVKITVYGVEFHAHKFVLAAASPVFDETLRKSENSNGILVLKVDDMRVDVMREMLKFIYTSKPPQQMHKLVYELLYAADTFKIKSLKELCEKQLCRDLNPGNAYDTLKLANKFKADSLRHRALKYMVMNPSEMMATESFQSVLNSNHSCFSES